MVPFFSLITRVMKTAIKEGRQRRRCSQSKSRPSIKSSTDKSPQQCRAEAFPILVGMNKNLSLSRRKELIPATRWQSGLAKPLKKREQGPWPRLCPLVARWRTNNVTPISGIKLRDAKRTRRLKLLANVQCTRYIREKEK